MVSGESDFLLHCVASDLGTFQSFVIEELTSTPNVDTVRTALTIRQVKDEGLVDFERALSDGCHPRAGCLGERASAESAIPAIWSPAVAAHPRTSRIEPTGKPGIGATLPPTSQPAASPARRPGFHVSRLVADDDRSGEIQPSRSLPLQKHARIGLAHRMVGRCIGRPARSVVGAGDHQIDAAVLLFEQRRARAG